MKWVVCVVGKFGVDIVVGFIGLFIWLYVVMFLFVLELVIE